jgi:hypothetical protein
MHPPDSFYFTRVGQVKLLPPQVLTVTLIVLYSSGQVYKAIPLTMQTVISACGDFVDYG